MFSQAEVFLSWKSLLLNNFFKDLNNALFELKDLVEKVWKCRLQQSKMLCSLILSILSIVGLLFSAGLSIAQSVSILLHATENRKRLLQTARKRHRRRQEEVTGVAAAQEITVDSEDKGFFSRC